MCSEGKVGRDVYGGKVRRCVRREGGRCEIRWVRMIGVRVMGK